MLSTVNYNNQKHHQTLSLGIRAEVKLWTEVSYLWGQGIISQASSDFLFPELPSQLLLLVQVILFQLVQMFSKLFNESNKHSASKREKEQFQTLHSTQR
jgi:hypothetical protein